MDLVFPNLELPVGLPPVTGDLGDELVRSNPRRGGEPGLDPNSLANLPGNG